MDNVENCNWMDATIDENVYRRRDELTDRSKEARWKGDSFLKDRGLIRRVENERKLQE